MPIAPRHRARAPLPVARRIHLWPRWLTVAMMIALAAVAGPRAWAADGPTPAWTMALGDGDRAVAAGDWPRAASASAVLDREWRRFEDGVRRVDRGRYGACETALGDLGYATDPAVADRDLAIRALAVLRGIPGTPATVPSAPADPALPDTLEDLRHRLGVAASAAAVGDHAGAAAALDAARRAWPMLEGPVRIGDPAAYAAFEAGLPRELHRARAGAADAAGIRALAGWLRPTPAVGWMEPALLVLREGLEALLIVGALITARRRAGLGAGPVWGGVAAGIAASAALAAALLAGVDAAAAAGSREGIEGAVGLVAAVVLIAIGGWLHRHHRPGAAVAGLSGAAAAWASLLAVGREGAETALFLGAMPGLAAVDLAIGLAAAAAVLAGLGAALLGAGRRLPLRWLFPLLTGLLLLIALRLAGTGVHNLQVAGWLAVRPLPVPDLPVLGWHASVQGLAAQAAALVAILLVLRPRRGHPSCA